MPIVPDFDERLEPALSASRYLKRELQARPWLRPLLAATIDASLSREAMQGFLAREAPDESRLKSGLRRLRSWVLCHTAVRDLLSLAPVPEVTETMTLLAETTIGHAHDVLHRTLAGRHGAPKDSEGRPVPLTIVGMGKLGGRELNVSSDIDLIFLYPVDGQIEGDRPVSYFDFFTRLGRLLISALGEADGDGFVFRVDMRLRPFGDSGPLAISYGALEHYFITQGREWERFAWIKARPLYGHRLEDLAQIIRPFVFRKYLDFGAISNLRDLHRQIRAQVARREMAMNIKLGPGGIREIEFIAQMFQIVRGGRDSGLQIRPTLRVLDLLACRGIIDGETVRELQNAYNFLRRLEHRLQYLDDAQTHDLPVSPEDRELVAAAMNCVGVSELLRQLEEHRAAVTACFRQVCGDPVDNGNDSHQPWDAKTQREEVEIRMGGLGFAEPGAAAGRLAQLQQGSSYRKLPDTIRQRLDSLIAPFIEGCSGHRDPDAALFRAFNLLETISSRGTYLALLQQYPQARQRLIELLAASGWAANYLTTHPILLDELLDGRNLDGVTDWPQFARQLRELLDGAEPDTERQMDIMREQHHAEVFRILHQDLAGKWEVEEIGDHLSALADVMLGETIRQCWQKYRNHHCETPRFAVIGYGKLGGKELGYGSDLDIVFLYDDQHPEAGEHYARLAQRMLTWMSSRTSAGILFETDTRLRPSGRSGLLVSRIDAFFKYQQESAWLWEHQALTRARFVAGDTGVGVGFERGRKELLCRPRELGRLAEEIIAMRRRLLDSHPGRANLFHLKDDPGGLVDLEFIIQYLVLGYAHRHPRLTANLGNIALARIAGELGLIEAASAKAAADAYRTLRRLQHRQRLNNEEGWLEADAAEREREAIRRLWLQVFGRAA